MDRDIDLPLLRTFVTVATTGSFTDASRRLLRTQPAISQRVQRLEEIMGASLLNRSPDGVKPTREGELILDYAKLILALHDDLRKKFNKYNEKKYIRIGIAEEFHMGNIGLFLKELRADFPMLTISADTRLNAEVDSRLHNGDYDIAIRASLAPPPEKEVLLLYSPLVWVSGSSQSFTAGNGLPLVLLAEGSACRQAVLSALMGAGIEWDVVFESPSGPFIREAVYAGLGLSALPQCTVPESLRIYGKREGFPHLPNLYISIAIHPHCARTTTMRTVRLLKRFMVHLVQQNTGHEPTRCE